MFWFKFVEKNKTCLRGSTDQGNWKLEYNNNIQEFLPDRTEHVQLDCVTHATSKLQHKCSATLGRLRNLTPKKPNKPLFSRVGCLVSGLCVIYCVVQAVQKVDEASNFAFVKLIEPEPGLKIHSDYAWRDNVDWGEREFHTRWRSVVGVYFLIKMCNKIQNIEEAN